MTQPQSQRITGPSSDTVSHTDSGRGRAVTIESRKVKGTIVWTAELGSNREGKGRVQGPFWKSEKGLFEERRRREIQRRG